MTWVLGATLLNVTFWPGPFVDWRTYVNAATRLASGEAIYAAEQVSGPYRLTDAILVGFAYPPASVPLFLPFASYPIGLAAFVTLNLGLLLTSLWALASRSWPLARVAVFSTVLVLLALFPPFVDGMVAMNVNVGLAGMIGWVAAGIDHRIAGLFGAVGAVLKVFPSAIALATTHKARSVGLSAILVVAVILLTLPIVTIGAWRDFATAMGHSVPDCQSWSVACAAAPIVGLPGGTMIGLIISGSAVVGLTLTRRPMVMALLVAIATMAPATNLHLHYWIIAFVLAFAAAGRTWEHLKSRVGPSVPEAGASDAPPSPV